MKFAAKRPGLLSAALAAMVLCVPNVAFAGGGEPADASSIAFIVISVLGVAAAYMFAHFVVGRLQTKLLIVAGVEFLLLGFMLGPTGFNLIGHENLTGVMPIIALAAGWVGLLRGTGFEFADLRNAKRGTAAVVVWHHVLPGVFVSAAAFWFFCFGAGWTEVSGPVPPHQGLVAAIVLGCCAASDSTTPFDVLDRRYVIAGKLAPFIRRATRYGDVFVIMAFGVLLAALHDGDVVEPLEPPSYWVDALVSALPDTWAQSVLLSLALGAGLGLLFSFFLGGDESENARFLALVGIITFASGAAYFVGFTPLAVNVVLGVVLVNTTRTGRQVRHTLDSTDHPMTLVLLVLAGLLFRPPELIPTIIGVAGFIVLRFVFKAIASLVTSSSTEMKRRDLFRGLVAHGDVTVAMVVSFRLFYDGIAVDIAYAVVLASVILHDLIGPRLLRSLLVDAGELRREREVIQTGLVVGSEWAPEPDHVEPQMRQGEAVSVLPDEPHGRRRRGRMSTRPSGPAPDGTHDGDNAVSGDSLGPSEHDGTTEHSRDGAESE